MLDVVEKGSRLPIHYYSPPSTRDTIGPRAASARPLFALVRTATTDQYQNLSVTDSLNELHKKQTPDWIGHGSGTDPIAAIAEKLIEAAYELFGRPPEAGGEYIHTVTRETDVPGYFQKMLQFARGRRSPTFWQHFKEVRNQDAEMVMDAGLKYLSQQATLPADSAASLKRSTISRNGIWPSSTKSTTS
jgi:hypothetical protein